jgi:hypothetical protein
MPTSKHLTPLLLVAAAMACGEGAPSASVEIVEPPEGATLPSSSVRIVLAAGGVQIGPAGQEGMVHHHLFIDRDLTSMRETIPAGEPGIVHLGAGQTEFTVENLSDGEHTIIAVLADAVHLPLAPPVTDTVRFAVRP